MMTGFQSLLDQGEALLESSDPECVLLSVAPGVQVRANVGQFRRARTMENTAFQWVEFGTIQIRRSALAEKGITAAVDAGQKVTVVATGKTYRVKYCAPDTTAYTLECVNFY